MKIFNLPSKIGFCDPFSAIGAVAGGAGLFGGSVGALGGMAIGSAVSGALGGGKKTKISAPTNRSYLGEMQDALNSQSSIQRQLIDLEGQYTPQYQDLQKTTLMGQMGTLKSLYGEAIPQSIALQSQYAQAQAPIYGQVGQLAQNAYQQSLDPYTRGLYASMMESAQGDLAAGRNLTPQQQQLAQQTARQAMAARGLSGNQAVAQEVLNTYQMQNAREDRARQFAGNMYNTGAQQTASAMGLYGSPLLANMNTVSPTGLLAQGQQMQQNLGAKIFQPESQYNAGVYGANQANQTQTALANAQIAAGQQSGLMSMLGSLGSAYIGSSNMFGGGYTPTFNSPDLHSPLPSWGSSITGASPYNIGGASLGTSMSGSGFGYNGISSSWGS